MKTLNELAEKHYIWLQKMGYNNTTNLESAGMILSEVGEAINECDPINLDNLETELADVILRSVGLLKRFNVNIDKVVKQQTGNWRKWSISKKWNDRNNLEFLALLTSQGVPIINKCRQEVPEPELINDISMLILSTLSIAKKNHLNVYESIINKIEKNIRTGNKGRKK